MRKIQPTFTLKAGRGRILFRIIYPFTFLFAVVTVITWISSTVLVSHYFDQNLRIQLNRVAKVVSHSQYLLNPVILAQVKEVANVDIVFFDGQGQVIAATLDHDDLELAIAAIMRDMNDALKSQEISLSGKKYRTVVNPLRFPGRDLAYLSLWQSIDDTQSFNRSIVLVTGFVAFLGVIALSAAGLLVARSISAPIVKLARITENVAEGKFFDRVDVHGNDEIALLARSFNRMTTHLQVYEKKLIARSKLSVVGQMTANIAHEMRNPLTSMKMFVQVLLTRMEDDPQNKEMLQALLSEINRLSRHVTSVVKGLMDNEPDLKLINVEAILDKFFEIVLLRLREKNIDIVREFAGVMNVFIDVDMMSQVFWNVVNNAIDVMPYGGVLTVKTSVEEKRGISFVVVSFIDEGRGFEKDVLDAATEPFFTTKPEGLGLGLSLSNKIMEKHGGYLEAANREDTTGAQLSLILPFPAEGKRG